MGFSGGYASATWTNNTGGTVSANFTLLVDLSNLPASWWSAVTSADGTKGRAAKNDGSTELAADWIDFDSSGNTGYVAVKWTSSIANNGSITLRIYPPLSGNSSYSDTDTYGSRAAWSTYDEVYFGVSTTESNRVGTGAVSVENGDPAPADGTTYDTVIDYDGNDNLKSSISHTVDTTTKFTFQFVLRADVLSNTWTSPFGVFDDTNNYFICYAHSGGWSVASDGLVLGLAMGGVANNVRTADNALTEGTEYHCAIVGDAAQGSNTWKIYIDGAEVTHYSSAGDDPSGSFSGTLHIGESGWGGEYIDGLVGRFMMSWDNKDQYWIEANYGQLSDNSTFWGSWSWTSGGTTHELAGSISALGSLSGDMEVSRFLSGGISALASPSGSLQVSRLLSGGINAAAAASAALEVTKLLTGGISAQAVAAGQLEVSRLLGGTVSGQASFSADLLVSKLLSGEIAAQALLSGDLQVSTVIELAGAISAVSSLTGDLEVTKLLAGTVAILTEISGGLEVIKTLAGNIAATADISADLLVSKLLSGDIEAVASMTGSLSVGQIYQELIQGISRIQTKISGSSEIQSQFDGESGFQTVISGESEL